MSDRIKIGKADLGNKDRLRYSVSLVRQGDWQFYTLTMPSDVLARTCYVSTRKDDNSQGFQRSLDEKRADEIADYIDNRMGTVPNSIVLSAQEEAELKIVGKGKTLEFNDSPKSFLVLDGQHRLFGFSKAKTSLRVPVVIYNSVSRTNEVRLFIDINTKQKPVPSELLLDIKKLAEIENATEQVLRDIFDDFDSKDDSALAELMSPSEKSRTKITRVEFNRAVKNLLVYFPGKTSNEIYSILNSYLIAVKAELEKKNKMTLISKTVVFRGVMLFFPPVAQRVVDRYGSDYSPSNFQTIIEPVFSSIPVHLLEKPGNIKPTIAEYLKERLTNKLTL